MMWWIAAALASEVQVPVILHRPTGAVADGSVLLAWTLRSGPTVLDERPAAPLEVARGQTTIVVTVDVPEVLLAGATLEVSVDGGTPLVLPVAGYVPVVAHADVAASFAVVDVTPGATCPREGALVVRPDPVQLVVCGDGTWRVALEP